MVFFLVVFFFVVFFFAVFFFVFFLAGILITEVFPQKKYVAEIFILFLIQEKIITGVTKYCMVIYVINFKAYKETIGKNGLAIAKALDEFANKNNKEIMIAVQPTDIATLASQVSIPVLAEHFDQVEPGARTGWLTLEAAVAAGAGGSLLNHSEHRLPHELIHAGVKMAKAAKKLVIVCARDAEEAHEVSKFKPDYVAVEPPELIGGDISVSKARPELISESVAVSEVPVLVGAGVKNSADVAKAVELGAKGVLVASGIVKAKDVKKAIKGLVIKGA